MKPTLKLLKNNIFTIFVIIVFVIGMFGLSYVKKIYWDNNGEAGYGDRTIGDKNNEITKEEQKEIVSKIKDNENVTKVEYELQGRTINLIITVKDDLSVSDAKKMGGDFAKNFTEDQLSYYALQIYFRKDNGKNDFPIVGYKHYSSSEISWTKDREATTDENK